MISSGLSERRSLRIIGMSASALRYEPASDLDPNQFLQRFSADVLCHKTLS
jgi:hypothetical protein